MKLYEIVEGLVKLKEMAEEEEVCDGVIADTLEGLEGEFEDKLEAWRRADASVGSRSRCVRE